MGGVKMKIRLAIIDDDESYVRRLVNNLQINYAEKVEPYFFSSFGLFMNFYQDNAVQVILVSESFLGMQEQIPENVNFAWLVANNAVQELEGRPAIAKFQKVELFYKSVLNYYADMENKYVLHSGEKRKCVVFTSAQGGVGVSSLAAAYAVNRARAGQRPFYLNLDTLSRPDLYFQGDGNFSFSEVIYALKTKKGNLVLKLESLVKRDNYGVQFFDTCRNANDMLEIRQEDIALLFDTMGNMEGFDCVVVDMPLDFSTASSTIMEKYADMVIFVGDGSEIGNTKYTKAMEVLKIRHKGMKEILLKTMLLYNRFEKGSSERLADPMVDVVGEINPLGPGTQEQIIEKLAVHHALKRIR